MTDTARLDALRVRCVPADTGLCVTNFRRILLHEPALLNGYDRVVLMNDTIRIHALGDATRWAAAANHDFWGLSESLEVCFHVQSFFLVLRGA